MNPRKLLSLRDKNGSLSRREKNLDPGQTGLTKVYIIASLVDSCTLSTFGIPANAECGNRIEPSPFRRALLLALQSRNRETGSKG